MIAPKVAAPSKREESEAYELAQLRDMGRCVRCGRADAFFGLSMDHRKNRSQGGLTLASNLQCLCGTGTTGCHGWKTENPREAVLQGFAVPGFADPAEFPAVRLVQTPGRLMLWPVMYTDDGKFYEISVRSFKGRLEAAGIDLRGMK